MLFVGIAIVAPPNEEGTRARVLRWYKTAGDVVRRDEPLLELETDKVTVEVPSPASGELKEILKRFIADELGWSVHDCGTACDEHDRKAQGAADKPLPWMEHVDFPVTRDGPQIAGTGYFLLIDDGRFPLILGRA